MPGWSAPLTVLPPGGGFTSVSCLSDTFCIAAGGGENQADAGRTGGAGVTDSWDGATWAEPSVYFPVPTGPAGAPAAPVMPAVSCTLGPECVVVDGTDHVSTGDGTDWSLPAALSPAPPLPANPADPGPGHPGSRRAAVSCSGPAFCAAVDNTGQAAVYKSGRWSPLQHLGAGAGGTGGPGGSALYVGGPVGLACPATDACLAVVGTATFGWDGTSWSPQAPWATAPGAGASGSGLSCPEVSSCWA
ncbi:MAG TPA: hypothetical protein VKW77_10025, partial [Acidimicrobiales bacterium]|nr:hypothetical protein [Acidimicrobiales bacterium]